jgi:EAL and modified HD-GYP domain-containing signal transduction protein
MLLDGSARVLDPNSVVIEILENTGYGPDVIEASRALVQDGYRLALDDFVYEPGYDPLLELAHIVKLDVLAHTPEELKRQLDLVRRFKVECLAERVETAEMRKYCASLGFDLFQGYYFARPETVGGRDVPLEQANIIRLLNLLRDPDTSDATLEDIFRSDVKLTYRLLRIVNSAATGSTGITSIGHAVRLLGRAPLHRWMALLLVSSLATREGGTHDELVEIAMVRARFSELLMEALGRRADGATSFVAGLFSLLDALLKISMPELLDRVNLTPELKLALVQRQGPFAPPLRIAEAYEAARWQDVFSEVETLNAPVDDLPELYLRAVEWARATTKLTTGG